MAFLPRRSRMAHVKVSSVIFAVLLILLFVLGVIAKPVRAQEGTLEEYQLWEDHKLRRTNEEIVCGNPPDWDGDCTADGGDYVLWLKAIDGGDDQVVSTNNISSGSSQWILMTTTDTVGL